MSYSVDPDELRITAIDLEAVRAAVDDLSHLAGHGVCTATTLGSGVVEQALREVSGDWSSARRRIGAEIEALSRRTAAAAATYGEVETGLTGLLTGHAPVWSR